MNKLHRLRSLKNHKDFNKVTAGIGIILFATIGTILLFRSHAATPFASVEPQSGSLSRPDLAINDTAASGGRAVKFGAPNTAAGLCPPVPAYPDANCTGWQHTGVTLTPSGSITVNASGTIDSKDISGTVTINASNVTLRRSRITTNAYAAIRIASTAQNVIIEDCEINGLGTGDNTGGINGPASVNRCNIYGVENGIVPESGSRISDNYIHDLRAINSPHYDGIQIDGGLTNINVSHNTIQAPSQTSAVMMDNCFGPLSNIQIDSNRLLGGGFTLYSDGSFGPGNTIDPSCDAGGTITGIVVTNNRFSAYQYGYALVCRYPLASWSGNVDDQSGASLAPPVLDTPKVNCP